MEFLLGVGIVLLVAYYLRGMYRNAKPEPPMRFTGRKGSGVGEIDGEDDQDAWEGGFWRASDPRPVAAYLEITYSDASEQKTTRMVRVRRFDDELYGGTFMAHCELRNAPRTFRFDRVLQCVDLDSGEIVRDLRAHLMHLYDNAPERSLERMEADYLDVLKVVYYVAKADGQYRKEEKAVVANYLRQLIRDDRVNDTMVDKAIKQIGVPSFHAYKLAIGRVLKGGEVNPALLAKCCRDIVATQKTVHHQEEAALEYLDKKLAATEAA